MGNGHAGSGKAQGKDELDAGKSDDTAKLRSYFRKLTVDAEGQLLSERVFKTLFSPCTEYGGLLFDHLKRAAPSNVQSPHLTCEDFVAESSAILQMLGQSQQLEYYFQVFSKAATTLDKAGLLKMLMTSYQLSWQYTGLSDAPELNREDSVLGICLQTLFTTEEQVSCSKLCSWALAPVLEGIHLFTTAALCGEATSGQATASGKPPLVEQISTSGTMMDPLLLWFLSSMVPALYLPSSGQEPAGGTSAAACVKHSNLSCAVDQWHLLYSSEHQGMSVNRFEHHVFAYKGPTLLLVAFENYMYCAAVDEEWKESANRWGGNNCQLYQLKPQCKVMPGGAGLMFLNIRDRTLPKGIGFEKNGRMTVDAEFAKVKHYGVDYKLHSIEVWGCGGHGMLTQQQDQKKWEKRDVEKQKDRKLKLEDWKDNPDRQLLELGGVQTEHEHGDRGTS